MTVARILLDIGVIDREQHAAAERFRAARAAGIDGDAESEFLRLTSKLDDDQLLEVAGVVADVRPGWLRRRLQGVPLSRADRRERKHLLDGLDALGA